ncbi:Maf family protein [Pontibaca methylaminivorans]|uniref:Maf family protein n=1 Tax=Pontibaca methylaminivorans TaxID=515897 RepID=UPI002FDB045A
MVVPLILASASPIRAALLRQAGLVFGVAPAELDEARIKRDLVGQDAVPARIATTLATEKALAVSRQHPDAFVIGCDQVLDHDGRLLSKPINPHEAREQLRTLRGRQHRLTTAAIVACGQKVIWTHHGEVGLHMRPLSDNYLDDYIARNWHSIREAVGAYKLEEEGVRLFTAIRGDYFHILGLPLLELVGFLVDEGVIEQ